MKGLNSAKKQKLDKKWATFFYEMNINFNVVWHPTSIKGVKATLESLTYYKPPSYYGLHIDLLKQSMVNVFKHISKTMWNSIHKYGVTIYFDGWDNDARCPLSNVMFPCPNGNVFIGAIDKIREHKDAQYICNTMVGYIENIGMDNIIEICINNALNMWNPTNLLICHFLGLYFLGCATHCLDLLLENWGKEIWVKWVVTCEKGESYFLFI